LVDKYDPDSIWGAPEPSSGYDPDSIWGVSSTEEQGDQGAVNPDVMGVFEKSLRRMAAFGEGVLDPIYGASQMLENTVEKFSPGVADYISEKDAELHEWSNGMLGNPAGVDVDEQLRRREEAFQNEYAPVSGSGALRVGGSIVPAIAAAPAVAAGSGVLRTAAMLGAEGAIGGAVMPQVGEGDYWDQVQNDALLGGATAGIGGTILNRGGQALTSRLNREGMGVLREAGVQPTVGQALGGMADTVEQKLGSVPLIGDAINYARGRAAGELREAAFTQAGNAVGEAVEETGTAGVARLQQLSDDAYDGLTKHLPEMKVTQEFAGSFDNILKEAGEAAYDTPSLKAGKKFIDDYIKPKAGSGKLLPDEIQEIDSMLKQRIAKSNSQDAKAMFSEIRENLMDEAGRQSPEFSTQLAKANELYTKKSIIQKASQSAEDFTPAQLDNAVKANDKAYGGGRNANNYTAGRGPLRELSRAGREVLGSTVPDSGTVGRAALAGLTGLGATGGAAATGALIPALATATAGALGSTRIGQKGIIGLLDILGKGGEKLGKEGLAMGSLLSYLGDD
jgi:hypothetical protein